MSLSLNGYDIASEYGVEKVTLPKVSYLRVLQSCTYQRVGGELL
jgi:hypothetical protein